MSDLDKLIAAVEAGTFPPIKDVFVTWTLPFTYSDSSAAFNGSLDAALRLHEALLPGWDYSVGAGPIQGVEGFVCLIGWQKGEADAESATPARAWLLAILRALKVQAE